MQVILKVANLVLLLSLLASPLYAQITLDGSMGVAGALSGPNFTIPSSVGQTRGSNLFHSFGLLNVQTGESATFTGPNSINNIFGRVTGGQPSNIDGTIRSTIPNANLYLMNPAGMLFGPNAFLDVSGSFHATTADYVKFADGAKFHADLSRQSTLTTAPVSAFGFLSQNPAGLLILQNILQLPPGNTLSLVGGDIDIVGDPFLSQQLLPTLSTFGGKIQLASVASPGEVPQNVQDLNPNTFERMGRITLSNAAYLDVSNYFGGPPGNVVIRGGRLTVDNGFIFADNYSSASGSSSAMDIQVTGTVSVTNGSLLTTDTFATSRAANLQILADTLEIDDSKIRSNVFASGNGGEVRVSARSITLSNGAEISTDTEGAGNSGNLFVEAGNLTLSSDSAIASDNSASGNGGQIQINVNESFALSGASGVTGSAQPGSSGNAGSITIEAGSLSAFGGSQIFGGTFGSGKGGTVRVNAVDDIRLDGIGGSTGNGLPRASGIASGANPGSTGDAGNLVIEARNIALSGGAEISSSTFGAGAGGNINISANTVSVDGSTQAGMITITSGIVASNQPGSTGNAGNILVDATNLTMTRGAQLASSTFGPGNGGTIHLTVGDTINLDGRDQRNIATSIAGGSGPGSTGNPGDILLEARNVIVTGGATISSSSAGSKDGGSVRITAADLIHVDGIGAFLVNGTDVRTSGIFASSQETSTGNGGDVILEAKNVIIHGAQISSGAFGAGNGGTVRITAGDTIDLGGFGFAVSENFVVQGGVFAGNQPGSAGKAGDILIEGGKVNLFAGAGVSSETFNDKAAGNIAVTGSTVTLNDGSTIRSASTGSGNAGDIFIQANEVRMKDSSINTQADFADGGNIHLKVSKLVDLVNSQITTSVQGGAGAGGNILIDPQFVTLNHSQITANAFGGPGGNITIVADNFLASTDSIVSASSALSTPGTVDIQAPIIDLTGSLAPLPEGISQASSLLRQSCAARYSSGKISSLAASGRSGMPFEPGGFSASPSYTFDASLTPLALSHTTEVKAAEWAKLRFSVNWPCVN